MRANIAFGILWEERGGLRLSYLLKEEVVVVVNGRNVGRNHTPVSVTGRKTSKLIDKLTGKTRKKQFPPAQVYNLQL